MIKLFSKDKSSRPETKADPTVETTADELKRLAKRIRKLEIEVQQLKDALHEQQSKSEAGSSVEPQAKTDAPAPDEQNMPRTIYLSAPSADGVFENFTNEPQIGHSIYELEYTNDNNGSFDVIQSKDAIATAIISVTQFLKPACKIESTTNGIPTKIVTLSKGAASFDGTQWKVTKKAVIRLEK